MSDYEIIFGQRARDYHEACQRFPRARQTERQLLIDQLRVEPEHIVLDHPAGDGYLAEGLLESCPQGHIICAEPVWAFASEIPKHLDRVIMGFDPFHFKPDSFDRVGSLAGLHHLEDKQIFFKESFRVLKPGGIVVAADVQADTPAAAFLNGPVDRLSKTGHKGMFFQPGDFSKLLNDAGFSSVQEKLHTFTWDFPDWSALLFFARKLFGMVKAKDAQIRDELNKHFEIREDTGVSLPWALIYAQGVKPQ